MPTLLNVIGEKRLLRQSLINLRQNNSELLQKWSVQMAIHPHSVGLKFY
jgi:hypothetical protein